MGKCKTKKNLEKTKKNSRKKNTFSRGLGGEGGQPRVSEYWFYCFFCFFSKFLTFLHGALPKESQNIDLFAVCVFDFIVKYTFAHMFQISVCTVCLICV